MKNEVNETMETSSQLLQLCCQRRIDMESEAYYVQCNMCMWRGDEEDLILEKEEDDFFKACPNCKTDAYLMDLPIGGVK